MMGFQKMVEHMQERQNVRLVPAPLSLADVIHKHVSDFLHAVRFLRKVLSECCSGDFRQMLMLRDCENLLLGQAGCATQSSKLIIKSHRITSRKIADAVLDRSYFPFVSARPQWSSGNPPG